mmetsp:Transcript_178/g.440  ORF Transcript_178/g.440 Transcript_178/m.440 type:complete len:112 (-) Transcript_178:2263-2598(-)
MLTAGSRPPWRYGFYMFPRSAKSYIAIFVFLRHPTKLAQYLHLSASYEGVEGLPIIGIFCSQRYERTDKPTTTIFVHVFVEFQINLGIRIECLCGGREESVGNGVLKFVVE